MVVLMQSIWKFTKTNFWNLSTQRK